MCVCMDRVRLKWQHRSGERATNKQGHTQRTHRVAQLYPPPLGVHLVVGILVQRSGRLPAPVVHEPVEDQLYVGRGRRHCEESKLKFEVAVLHSAPPSLCGEDEKKTRLRE